MRPAETDARLACQDLMIQSYRLVDDGHASRVADLFTTDGRFKVAGSIDVAGRDALAKFFSAREADSEGKTRHCLTNLTFASTSPGEAAIRATLLLFVVTGSDATKPRALADVEDHYRAEGGSWRIASRTTTPVASGA